MATKIYYQEDCNLSLLEGKTIAIIGYERKFTIRKTATFPYWKERPLPLSVMAVRAMHTL